MACGNTQYQASKIGHYRPTSDLIKQSTIQYHFDSCKSFCGTWETSADQDQTSDQCLHCFLIECPFTHLIKDEKYQPTSSKTEMGWSH